MAQINRRKALFTAGGGAALILGAGGIWSATRTPKAALKPWAAANEAWPDPRLYAFAHAILAPNALNLQPWRIRLDGETGATIFCDPTKRLPATDPFDRQTTISFGAFLELAHIAAAEKGLRLSVTPFPEGPALPTLDERPIAQLTFTPDAATQKYPLFAAILKRRTNRADYDTDIQLSSSDLDALRAQGTPAARIDALAARDRVSNLRTICTDALVEEARTDAALNQQVSWVRIGKTEIEAQPDGISIAGAGVEAASMLGALSRDMLLKRNSSAARSSITRVTDSVATSMAFAWVLTPGNTREDQLAAGAAYARLNLEAAARGIAVHPISAPLQEIPQLAASRKALTEALKPPEGLRIQMLARLGKTTNAQPAPRWPLSTRIINT